MSVIQRDVTRHEDKCLDNKKNAGLVQGAGSVPSAAAVSSRLSALAHLKEQEGVPNRAGKMSLTITTGSDDDDDDYDNGDEDDTDDDVKHVKSLLLPKKKATTSVGGALAGLSSLTSMATKNDSDRCALPSACLFGRRWGHPVLGIRTACVSPSRCAYKLY